MSYVHIAVVLCLPFLVYKAKHVRLKENLHSSLTEVSMVVLSYLATYVYMRADESRQKAVVSTGKEHKKYYMPSAY